MSESEQREYSREYRAIGLGKIADRRYYHRNKKRRNAQSREYYKAHKEDLSARALARYNSRKVKLSH